MTDSSIRYVGLDVHKRVVEACLVDQAARWCSESVSR
jgi:hypothetical protein